MRPKNTARNAPLDLDEILGVSKTKERAKTTSVRLPPSLAAKLREIAESRKMTQTRLIRNLIEAFVRDYEERHGTKRR